MRKKGTLPVTMFTKIMTIFLVIGIVAIIWIFIGKVQEVKRISEQNEKRLVIWNTLITYKPLRSYTEYGDMEFLYDFEKLNEMSMFDSLDCKTGLSHPGPEECIKIYPNNYFFRIYLEDVPKKDTDIFGNDYEGVSDEELHDYYTGMGHKCTGFFRSMENHYKIKGDATLDDAFRECNINLSRILVLAPPYDFLNLHNLINDFRMCKASVDLNLDDKQKNQFGDMVDFCTRSSYGRDLEWRWGDSNVPINFREIIGIRIGDDYYIGKVEAGVELLE